MLDVAVFGLGKSWYIGRNGTLGGCKKLEGGCILPCEPFPAKDFMASIDDCDIFACSIIDICDCVFGCVSSYSVIEVNVVSDFLLEPISPGDNVNSDSSSNVMGGVDTPP